MVQRIAIVGSMAKYPFLGHLTAQVEHGGDVISVAARFAHQSLPMTTFQLVRKVEAELRIRITKIASETPNLPDWIRNVWAFWMAQPKSNFGPESGSGLSVVIYIRCDGQEAISASGVTGIWGLVENHWAPVVKPGHPMLRQSGVPDAFPGVFQLSRSSPFFVAAPHPDLMTSIELKHIDNRLGGQYDG